MDIPQHLIVKQYRVKTAWTEQENELFAELELMHGKNFAAYQRVLHRSYSQIKSHYHNQKRRSQSFSSSNVSAVEQKVEYSKLRLNKSDLEQPLSKK